MCDGLASQHLLPTSTLPVFATLALERTPAPHPVPLPPCLGYRTSQVASFRHAQTKRPGSDGSPRASANSTTSGPCIRLLSELSAWAA